MIVHIYKSKKQIEDIIDMKVAISKDKSDI